MDDHNHATLAEDHATISAALRLNAEKLAAAILFIAEVHAAVGDPEQNLTRAHVLARINAMTVTLTALTSRKDHTEIISQVTEFANTALK